MDNPILPGDMSEMLGRLMADEKFGELVESLKGSFSTNADNSTPAEESPATEAVTAAQTEESASVPGIPKLSPEIIAKLPEIMGMLSSSEGGKKHNSKMEDRKRLLTAMKPFLSEKRRHAVDSIVNIAGFADLFGL